MKILFFSGAGLSADSGLSTFGDMYRAFESLTDEDMVVVVGTNGSVVPIDMILGDKISG